MLPTSVKKLDLLAKLIDKKPLQEAMLQLMFSKRRHANEVLWALQSGAKIGRDIQHMDPSRMIVGMSTDVSFSF
jgi:hypothetical protein